MSAPVLKFAFPILALSLGLLFSLPAEGSARARSCTSSYLVCLNHALDGGNIGDAGDFSDELGSVECAAGWAGCVLNRFRRG